LEESKNNLLLLGEFGTGKSTLLAQWGAKVCGQFDSDSSKAVLPVMCSLAGAQSVDRVVDLLIEATGAAANQANRAGLRLLMEEGMLLPILDGFDEMGTRVLPSELAGRLSDLLKLAGPEGRVLISCRDHYFPTESDLIDAWQKSLSEAAGSEAETQRVKVQRLDSEQIRSLVVSVKNPEDVDAVIDRIVHQYPLSELAEQPLLLSMVLATFEDSDGQSAFSRAELYEQFLDRWLKQTEVGDAEVFTPTEKQELAEVIASQLWRSGSSSLHVTDLEDIIRIHALPQLAPDQQPGAAFLETYGGSFFVHDGEEDYRFAHRSFLEFFYARSLIQELQDDPVRALDTREITREVSGFFGELLRRDGVVQEQPAWRALVEWITNGRRTDVDEEASARAATNAVRLFQGLRRWDDSMQWIPPEADLHDVNLEDQSFESLQLEKVNLHRARLARTQWHQCQMRNSDLSHACLAGSLWTDCELHSTNAAQSDWNGTAMDRCQMARVEFTGASFRQSTWTRNQQQNVNWAEADSTAQLASHSAGAEGGKLTPELQTLLASGHQDWVRRVAFSPDGSQIVSASDDKTIRLWDTEQRKQIATLEGHQGYVRCVAFSPDGSQIVSASNDKTICLWDTQQRKQIATLEGHQSSVSSVAFSPDGSQIVSAS
ncbi:MAG: pentapeptide repeat-containing protein, partial [Planctomycetota bacterium]